MEKQDTNEEELQRTGKTRLQDTVAERRFQFAGHICLPQTHCAMDWSAGEREENERRKKTWRTTFKEDLKQKQQQQNVAVYTRRPLSCKESKELSAV